MKYFYYCVLALLIFPGKTIAQAPTNGLVAYYPFNGNANDESSNGNNGTLRGAPLFTPGISGDGIYLTGACTSGFCEGEAGDHVLLPALPFNSMPAFCINIWVKESGMVFDHGESYIYYGNDQTGAVHISHFSNTVTFSVSSSTTVNIQFDAADIGHYVMYTISYSNNQLKAYKNSILVGTANGNVNVVDDNAAIARHWWTSTSTRFTGSIDEVRIYNRFFSDAEILQLYLANAPCNNGKPVVYASLIDASTQPNGNLHIKMNAFACPANNTISQFNYWFDDEVSVQHIYPAAANPIPFITDINCEQLSEGVHILHYQFVDAAGNTGEIMSKDFTRAPMTVKEIIEPKLFIDKSKVNIGQTLKISGEGFFPHGSIDFSIKDPFGNAIYLAPPSVDDNGNFVVYLTATDAFKAGEYEITARDNSNKKQLNEIIKFLVSKPAVLVPAIKILSPTVSEKIHNSTKYTIMWGDFIAKGLTNGQTAILNKHYKIEQSTDDGNNWQTIIDDTKGNNNPIAGAYSSEFSYTAILKPGYLSKIKITDLSNDYNFSTSGIFSVIGLPQANFRTSLEWDKSFIHDKKNLSPSGLAADGTSRIFVQLSSLLENNAEISRITAKIVSADESLTGPALLGKIMFANNTTSYSLEANEAKTTSIVYTPPTSSSSFSFWLVAPDDFTHDETSQESERELYVEFTIDYFDAKKTTDIILSKKIKIVRPPLMLVHGLNGDETTFKNAKYKDPQSGTIKYFDHSAEEKNNTWKYTKRVILLNYASYDLNAKILLNKYAINLHHENTFNGLISKMDAQGYACNRVDYVCHSMGGCIVRYLINQYPNDYNPPKDFSAPIHNYGRGFINKLITINTPFEGSTIADFLIEQYPTSKLLKGGADLNPALKKGYYQPFPKKGISDAIRDLQYHNTDGVKFKETVVKNHLIASDADKFDISINPAHSVDIILDIWGHALKVLCNTIHPDPTKYFSTTFTNSELWHNSDIVVPVTSQLGNSKISSANEIKEDDFRGDSSRSIIYSNQKKPAGIPIGTGSITNGNLETLDASSITHTTITDNIAVGSRIMLLLNSAIDSSRFEDILSASPNLSNSSNIHRTGQLDNSKSDSIINIPDTNAIKIVFPLDRSIVFTDSSIIVKLIVKDTLGLSRIQVVFQGAYYESNSKTEFQTFNIKVHNDAIGKNELFVNAIYDSAGFILNRYDTANLITKSQSQLSNFSVYPTTRILNRQQYFTLNYQAQYTEYIGTLNSNIDSLQISVADTNVLRYDSLNYQFITKDTGSTYIVFDYKGFKDTAYISVDVAEEKTNTALPVKLSSFSAALNCNSAKLYWTTAQESNNNGFDIESSSNGLSFKKEAFVRGAGNSSTSTNYIYGIGNLPPGINYFRLKQTDLDGEFTYSKTIAVKVDCNKNSIALTPNPAADHISITGLDITKAHTLRIFDSKGTLVKIISKVNPGSIDISRLATGLYLVKIDDNQILKFIKQ